MERERQRRQQGEKEGLNWKKFIGLTDETKTSEKQLAFHMSSFDNSALSENPYANTALVSPETRWRFCWQKIREIRERIAKYYKYTDGRVKPEDICEICLYRNELKKLNGGKDLYQQRERITQEPV